MSGRPCNPGSDLRQLWRALLGKNTPFPQCSAAEGQDMRERTGDAPDGETPGERPHPQPPSAIDNELGSGCDALCDPR